MILAPVLASVLAVAIGTDAQARGGGHGFHLGPFHFGFARTVHRGFGHRHFGRHSFAARHGMRAAAALGAGHFARNYFVHNNFHNVRTFRGGYGYGYGWYGPVFWPYAYDDIFVDLLWGFGLGGPFWDYGYGDVYGGLFSPYGYNDLASYPPAGAPEGATPSRANRRTHSRQAALSSQLSQMCGDDSREVAGWPIDRIAQSVSPTPEQSAALDEFANATIVGGDAKADRGDGARGRHRGSAARSLLQCPERRAEGAAQCGERTGAAKPRIAGELWCGQQCDAMAGRADRKGGAARSGATGKARCAQGGNGQSRR
jgi:hypothetical protein